LTKVLTTHHHWDHADGNPGLLKNLNESIPVYGYDERIPALSNKLRHNDDIQVALHPCFGSFCSVVCSWNLFFKIGSGLHVKCLFTPCHTTGHMCYYVTHKHNDKVTPCVFTGDTLFLSGCGRFFEGTAQQMYDALIKILSELPNQTVFVLF
jgi:hydroxyacylglutathione hydrolase